jgi:hypothetical protein
MIIRAKIDVAKIPKSAIFVGAKGKYIDITLLENRDGPDAYGNDFMVVLDLGKEARQRGEKGPILGNAKKVGNQAQAPAPAQHSAPASGVPAQDGDVPW